MESTENIPCRTQLSKGIADKIELIAKLRSELDDRRRTIGTSLDDQLLVAELEYRLVKEEMSLLSLQEQHWESAAKWDIPPQTPDIQKELCEVLHSYIASVREKGVVPVLHAAEPPSSAPDNAVLISQDGRSMPRVEWAHRDTELQAGDRLLEVNGHLVIGRDPCDVSRILGRPLRRVVFLRPLSANQAIKGGGVPRETSNLRQELTAVVSRLNKEMAEKARLAVQNKRIQNDSSDLKTQNRKLKLQVLSLQSILIYLYQTLEKTNYSNLLFNGESPSSALDMLRNIALDEHCSVLCSETLKDVLSTHKKSIPWLELKPQVDGSNAAEHENEDHR